MLQMAVAMDVVWSRGAELSNPPGPLDVTKRKRAVWGADAQKVVQLMMGQLRSPTNQEACKPTEEDVTTLDLLGCKTITSSPLGELDCNSSRGEFLELDPDQPLPSGWEKCLDLKTGRLYFVNKQTGARCGDDPRKHQQKGAAAATSVLEEMLLTAAPTRPLAHEFLCSKQSETLREEISLRTSSGSSSSGASPRSQLVSNFSPEKQLWSLKLDGGRCFKTRNSCDEFQAEDDSEKSNLELDLNLAAGVRCSPEPQQRQPGQSVCTMEMVQKALKRTGELMGKRSILMKSGPKQSSSSSLSSLTLVQSAEVISCPHQQQTSSSPSTSSSSSESSTSSKSSFQLGGGQTTNLQDESSSRIGEGESKADTMLSGGGALVMGACTRCLMYVMLNKSDPVCPRCESKVPLDFSAPPSKRQRTVVDHCDSGSDHRRQ